MAAKLETALLRYIGTAAERVALTTTGLKVGSEFRESDTGSLYKWTGSVWFKMVTDTTATINTGDIEIGAVEIKNGATDDRASVNTNGGLLVAIDQTTANAKNVSSAGSVAEVQKTRPANTTAYTALDVVGTDAATNIEFASVIPLVADTVIITGAYMRIYTASLPAGMTGFRLHLYSASPTAITDNLAFEIADADRSKYLGYIEFDTPADLGGNMLWTQKENINMVRKLASASTSIFGVLQTLTGFTPTSGCIKEIGLCVLGR